MSDASLGPKKMYAVTDSDGNIVAAAIVGEFDQNSTEETNDYIRTRVKPLPGQDVHLVEIPSEISSLASGRDWHAAFTDATVEVGERPRIHFRRLRGEEQG